MLGAMANAIDLDAAGRDQLSVTAQQIDAVRGKPALLPRVRIIRNH
jgi:hypothetical protein